MKKLVLIVLLLGAGPTMACSEGPGIIAQCFECSSGDDLEAALESIFPNEVGVAFTVAQAQIQFIFQTLGFNSTIAIRIDKSCNETWSAAVERQWSDMQEQLADLLLASSGGSGGFGGGSGSGTGGSGGGPAGASGGGRVGGGSGDDYCYYSDGQPIAGNPPDCPPSDPNVGFSE